MLAAATRIIPFKPAGEIFHLGKAEGKLIVGWIGENFEGDQGDNGCCQVHG
jgi:hypothetical protein